MRNEKGQFVKGSKPQNYIGLTTICLRCTKEFKTKPCLIKKGWSKYCSKQCHAISKQGKTQVFNLGNWSKGKLPWNKGLKGFMEGEKNSQYKGDNVGYSGVHDWMYYHYGQPNKCDHCATKEAKRYEWANRSGEYKRERNDWLRLCKKCHHKFDNISQKMWKTRREKTLAT